MNNNITPKAACTSPGCAKPENVQPRGPIWLPLLLAADPTGHTAPAEPDTGHRSDILEDIFD